MSVVVDQGLGTEQMISASWWVWKFSLSPRKQEAAEVVEAHPGDPMQSLRKGCAWDPRSA